MIYGRTPTEWIRFWFSLTAPVNRQVYLLSGLFLMAIRIIGEAIVLLAMIGADGVASVPLAFYIAPTFGLRSTLIQSSFGSDEILVWTTVLMAVWALPLLWIGVAMTFRRARDAGVSQWWGLMFFAPILNFLAIAVFATMPSAPPKAVAAPSPSEEGHFKAAMIATGLAVSFSVAFTAISVLILGDYGSALFVATPVVMGTIAGWRVNRPVYRGLTQALISGLVACIFCGGALVVFALEGIVCLAMVAPLVIILTLVGAAFGAGLARSSASSAGSVTSLAIVIPIIGTSDANLPTHLPLYAMTSEIHVDAPPEAVWPNVVGFSDLPPPSDWLMNTGIACPLRARIEGEGVGAVRYCEFTTGSFVEPITVWDPPHTLAFNVIEQPQPMAEWSPYEVVYAPHLDNTMLSQHGQFQLIATDDGGTLLRGTTWYTLDLAPGAYWRLWSDFVVHRIHNRVLRHVKQLSEA